MGAARQLQPADLDADRPGLAPPQGRTARRPRQPCDPATRADALARLAAGETGAAVAAELGIGLRTLRRWAAAARPARRAPRARTLARTAAALRGAPAEFRAELLPRLRYAERCALEAGELGEALRLLSVEFRVLGLTPPTPRG